MQIGPYLREWCRGSFAERSDRARYDRNPADRRRRRTSGYLSTCRSISRVRSSACLLLSNTAKFKDSEVSKTIWPRRTPLRAFRGNVAHSNFDGFMFDRNIYEDNTFGLATIPFLPLTNPADLDSEVVETHFESLTSYKNRNGGLWSRGDLFVFSNLKLADNAIGMTSSAGDIGSSRFKARLVDSLVVGETDNSGNPTTPEEVAYGRSLPEAADS